VKVSEAVGILGADLSKPSKMPGFGFSIPAEHCITGSKLAKVEGTPCHICYAKRGNYTFPSVKAGLEKRYKALSHDLWVDAAVLLVDRRCTNAKCEEFRWFDSGDLQGVWHLRNIVKVCELTPHINHWLPTQERGILSKYLSEYGSLPDNLCVRISGVKIGDPPPKLHAFKGMVQTSSVNSGVGFSCEAKSRGNECGPCRACWSKSIPNVDYPQH
tara:strand:+ start:1147 stop:1791 length:645 start_codon:yes stop_codon:yes gene_type:complete